MPQTDLILQGLTNRTHAEALRQLLSATPDIQRVTLSVAFINEGGVELVENELRTLGSRVRVYAGIRNEITSVQGLNKLLEVGAEVFVVDTASRSSIYHPKVYLVRGTSQARMIIGSANFTIGGLNNNLETSAVLTLDLNEAADADLARQVEDQLMQLSVNQPQHVFRIHNQGDLSRLKDAGRLLDESESAPPRAIGRAGTGTEHQLGPLRLAVNLIRRTLRRPARAAVPHAASTPQQRGTVPGASAGLQLVWASKPLTERDLNIPTGQNTNRTGSVSLDKGELPNAVDHRHYFRDIVFDQLAWGPGTTAGVEKAEANFRLIVKEIDYGVFRLAIAHTTSTTSAAYVQHNAMTRLRWGSARQHIAHRDLIDRTLSLYRDEEQSQDFVLEID